MQIKPWMFWLSLLTFFMLIISSGSLASEQLIIDYAQNIPEIIQFKTGHQGIYEYYGEIYSINQNHLGLKMKDRIVTYKMMPGTVIFCNGYAANWQALLPVTDQAYFEAKIYVNPAGEICAVNGFYYGVEGVVHSYLKQNNRLQITLYFPEQNKELQHWVSETATLPNSKDWLRSGQVVFILYNYQNEIRAVFLP